MFKLIAGLPGGDGEGRLVWVGFLATISMCLNSLNMGTAEEVIVRQLGSLNQE